MKNKILPLLVVIFMSAGSILAQGTAFTYQGELQLGGSPANGGYDFTFALFNSSSSGQQIGNTITNLDVGVTNGLFKTTLDFGSVFTGNATWLSMGVRSNGGNTFTPLNPLQELTPTPYSLFAPSAGTAQTASSIPLTALPAQAVTNGQSGVNIAGNFSGNGAGLTNVSVVWQTVAGTNQTAAANQSYLLTNNALATLTLPANPNVGDIVTVSGTASNGWQVLAVPGQTMTGLALPVGVVWTLQSNWPSGFAWNSLASSADGSHLVAAGTNGALYVSTNFGVTWLRQNAPAIPWTSVASSADGSRLVASASLSASNGAIFVSVNYSPNWSQAGGPTNGWRSVASSADGSHLAAMTAAGSIYTSVNYGSSWTEQINPPNANGEAIASSADGSHLFGLTYNTTSLLLSSNFGASWRVVTPGQPIVLSAICESSDGTLLAAAELYSDNNNDPGNIFISTDFGVSFVQQNAPSNFWSGIASSADGSQLAAVVSGGGIYMTTNSGANWTMQPGAPTAQWTAIASSSDGSHLVAATRTAIYTSAIGSQPFAGASGEVAQFQYLGNGLWQPLNSYLNVSQLASGTVPLARLPLTVVTNYESAVTLSGTFIGGSTGLTNLNVAALAQFQSPVVGWGDNSSQQTNVPPGLSNVVAIAGGGNFGLALLNNGTVVAWGDSNNPNNINVPSGLSNVVSIAAGSDAALALLNNGTVVAWGGLSDPFEETNVPPGLSNVTAIAEGQGQGLALLNNGTVTVWGLNLSGSTTIPPGLANVAAISSQAFSCMALLSNGTVVAWGDNTEDETNVPSGLSNVTAIAAGGFHDLALLNNGTVVGWGWNLYGQATSPPGLSNVAAIAAGESFSMALLSNGTVVAWGYDLFGQTNVPAGLSQVTAISAGSDFALALRQQWGTVQAVLQTPQGTIAGNGAGLTNIVAANLTGTLPDGLLSTNVALLNGNPQVFTGGNTFAAPLILNNSVQATDRLRLTGTEFYQGYADINGISFVLGVNRQNDRQLWVADSARLAPSPTNSVLRLMPGVSQSSIDSIGTDGATEQPLALGQSGLLYLDTNGNVGIGTTTPTNKLQVNGGITCTLVTTTSDRNAKENFAPVSPGDVLAKVTSMPITTWNFKEIKDSRHIGPMAQDFHDAFGLNGGDDRHIATVDEDGVALAAIQGLNQKLEAQIKIKDDEIQALKDKAARIDSLEKEVTELKQWVQSLAAKR